MRLRLASIDEYQLLTCLKHQVWGSRMAIFSNWEQGDYLGFIVDRVIAGLAVVEGEPYISDKPIWENDIFPNRIPIRFVRILTEENRVQLLGEVRDALTTAFGTRYGWGILAEQAITDSSAEIIIREIQTKDNALEDVRINLEQLLREAKLKREESEAAASKKRGRKPKHIAVEPIDEHEVSESAEEGPLHSRAQETLIRLGKITDCSVWIASDNAGALYKGKPLGDGCLKTLPNLGLNSEATKRISKIDVIWICEKAPVCAFEVETTTSIYSGLLRMSDLVAIVPVRIRLFIVAQRERQNKVMRELDRPTFRKVGLNEVCRFIAIEDLEALLNKVNGLEGAIQPNVVEKIAIELEDELESALE